MKASVNATRKSNVKRNLLLSTALLPLALGVASAALADSVVIGGVTQPYTPPNSIDISSASAVAVTIDTASVNGYVHELGFTTPMSLTIGAGQSINSTIYGAYLTTNTGTLTVVDNGAVNSAGNGITTDSRFAPDGGSDIIKGSGSITSTGGLGIWALADSNPGTITIDGFAGGIKAASTGILVNTNGTYSNFAGGAVNIGQTTVLGNVTAGGNGVEVQEVYNSFGNGDINVHVSNITTTGGYGIRTVGWTGNTNIVIDGNITSTSAAVYGTATSGNQSITVNGGTIKSSADNGLVLDSRFAPDGGNVTVTGNSGATVTSTPASAIWALADTGTVTIDGFSGGINGGTWGILVNSNGTYSTNAGGVVNIGQNQALGNINAGTVGIDVEQAANIYGDGAVNITANNITSGTQGIHVNAWTAPTTIIDGGAINAGDIGVWVTSTTGNNSVSGLGTGTIIAQSTGVKLDAGFAPAGGDNTLQNFASIKSTGAGAWLLSDGGNNLVTNNAVITSTADFGVLMSNSNGGNNTVTKNGPITASKDGVNTTTDTGTTLVDSNGFISSTAGYGVQVASTTGKLTVTNNNGIQGGIDGVYAHSISGNIVVDSNKDITGKGGKGVSILDGGSGTVDVSLNGNITGNGGDGILSIAATGATTINGNGFIHSTTLYGIDASSTTGAISVTNNNGITGDVGDGVWAHNLSGGLTINNNGNVLGKLNYGITAWTTGADTNLQGNGNITGTNLAGIYATNSNGNINIGTTTTNADILGGQDGIYATNAGTGQNNITVDHNVTGTSRYGIYSTTASGNQTNNIAATSVVQGAVYGLSTATT